MQSLRYKFLLDNGQKLHKDLRKPQNATPDRPPARRQRTLQADHDTLELIKPLLIIYREQNWLKAVHGFYHNG
eukprot:scaffold142587_cov55-Attheya_sp.AAC.1